MLWEWWSNLSHNQQTGVFIAIPFFLFFMNLLLKNGFHLPIDTAGGDLCLAAVSLDISQMFIVISDSTKSKELSLLLLALAVVHLFLWVSSLRLVSFGEYLYLSRLRIGTSYFLGLLAFYTSLGTILQFMIQ